MSACLSFHVHAEFARLLSSQETLEFRPAASISLVLCTKPWAETLAAHMGLPEVRGTATQQQAETPEREPPLCIFSPMARP